MSRLAVVTHARLATGSAWYEQCQASIAQALPEDAQHHFIHCPTLQAHHEARWQALKLAEYICFVDDDDLVLGDSLRKCKALLDSRPEITAVFTNERYIDEEGKTLPSIHPANRKVRYRDIASNPQAAHHLVMLRTKAVQPEAQQLGEKLGVGYDWLLKASAAFSGTAVHLNVEGYGWRQLAGNSQMSRTEVVINAFNSNRHLISKYLHTQVRQRIWVERID